MALSFWKKAKKVYDTRPQGDAFKDSDLELEKGDAPAILIAGLIVFIPAILILIAVVLILLL